VNLFVKKYNAIMVFDKSKEKVLMCKRRKDPYKGLSNLVGGKIEPGEDGLEAAYRELVEETAIGRQSVTLVHVMDFTYYLSDMLLEIYAGILKDDVQAEGDENELYWEDAHADFFDMGRYAGEGNIGHILQQVLIHNDKLS